MADDPPSQSHSDTSVAAGLALSRYRFFGQERWVYETLRHSNPPGLADWELWELAEPTGFFDKLSSLRRARIGLYWRSRKLGATPWHPVEDSRRRNRDPGSNHLTTIWKLKDRYLSLTYDQWAKNFRNLARGDAGINEEELV